MPTQKPKKSPAKGSKAGKSPKSSSPGLQVLAKHKGLLLLIMAVWALLMAIGNFLFFSKKEVSKKEILVKVLQQISGAEKESGPFVPQDLAAIGNDRFVISDDKGHRLVTFDRQGNFLKEWTEEAEGDDPKQAGGFAGVSTDDKGNIYVIDGSNATLLEYDPEGSIVQKLGLGSLGCYVPRSVYWSGSFFYVADTGGHRILKVAPDGTMAGKWGQHGDCKECFDNPYKVVPDGKGNFYINDYDNFRVVYVDGSGKIIRVIKTIEGKPNEGRPNAVAVDAKGNLYIGSTEGGGFVRVFSNGGKTFIGTLKDVDGGDTFSAVRALAFLSDGTLVVGENDGVALVKILPAGESPAPNPSK